jgi:uncharacterized repeat protein (TIGR01451 family)
MPSLRSLFPGRLALVVLLAATACQRPGDTELPKAPAAEVQVVQQAHTSAPTGHTCCTWELEHCSMAGTAGLPAQCSQGHRTTDVSCDFLCCLGHIFSDPCPGFIIGSECSRAFETAAATDGDGDGLSDDAEVCGIDTNFDGQFDLNLSALGADPNHKDLFLELDWMPGQQPNRAGIQRMKQAFSAAPINAGGVSNPDGQPGINLWVDTGALSDPTAAEDGGAANSCNDGIDNGGDGVADAADPDCLVGDNFGGGNAITQTNICDVNSGAFVAAKGANFNLAQRRNVFRYAISAQGCDADMDGNIDSGGWGEIGGNDFIEYNHDGGTIMHELGHTLNLRHGGNVNANCKPNYVSVMNYDNQFGIRQNGGGTILDYSPPRFAGGRGTAPLATLVENNLNDNITLDATDTANRYVFVNPAGNKVQRALNLATNWNGDADPPFELSQTINIDTNATGGGPAACANTSTSSTLTGFDDWTSISLPFRQFAESADGVFSAPTDPEPTLAELRQLERELNKTDISVTGSAAPSPAVAGGTLDYAIAVHNAGPNPAGQMELRFQLPTGVTLLAGSPGCAEQPSGELLCRVTEILADGDLGFTFHTRVAANFVYQGGSTLAATARVSHLAGPDPQATNNEVTITTPVVAVSDLGLRDLALSAPAEAIVGQPVTVDLSETAENLGPSSPADAVVSTVLTAPAGAHVLVAPPDRVLTALAVGAPAPVQQQAQIACDAPGPQVFQVASRITLARPGETDPNAANDQVITTFQVDCVVPVQINIQPHGNPNSINRNGAAVVAVLTTAAGEYGLPLAFDARRILPLTVRFGTETETFNGTTGALEFHSRGHLEDGWELDERTRDGDIDMILHFRVEDTAIQAGDSKACVKGEWLDAGGIARKFFGCDSIVLRP